MIAVYAMYAISYHLHVLASLKESILINKKSMYYDKIGYG